MAPAANAAPAADIKVSQNYAETIVPNEGLACNDGVTVFDTKFFRRVDLSAYGAASGFTVSSITVAVEVAESTAGNVPGTVSVYALDHAAALTTATLGAPVATVPVNFDSVANGSLLTAPISATVPAGKDMVVAASVATATDDELFFMGANTEPQVAEAYLQSATCGATEPTELSGLDPSLADTALVFYAKGKTTDCKTAETALNTATAAAAAAATKVTTATAAVTKADKKVKKAKKSLKKAKKSGDADKIKKAKKKLKKAKKAAKAAKAALAAAQAALTAANAAVTTATAGQNTKCAQPVLPPALPRPSQNSEPTTGSNGAYSFSNAR